MCPINRQWFSEITSTLNQLDSGNPRLDHLSASLDKAQDKLNDVAATLRLLIKTPISQDSVQDTAEIRTRWNSVCLQVGMGWNSFSAALQQANASQVNPIDPVDQSKANGTWRSYFFFHAFAQHAQSTWQNESNFKPFSPMANAPIPDPKPVIIWRLDARGLHVQGQMPFSGGEYWKYYQ
jgi:hypothetical protein